MVLLKFGRGQHLEEFRRDGRLFMNPQKYFADIEGDAVRSDRFEGTDQDSPTQGGPVRERHRVAGLSRAAYEPPGRTVAHHTTLGRASGRRGPAFRRTGRAWEAINDNGYPQPTGAEDRAAGLANKRSPSHAPTMLVVTEAEAAAIRAVYEQRGEFSAAVELRRLFPAVTDTAQARACARTIAGWKPLPAPPRLATRAERRGSR
jgi:hypothetical protein